MSFWKILRILVTDYCNYRCIYCHNEGQEHKSSSYMHKEDCFKFFDAVRETPIREVRFSGGEPLLNPGVIDMIEYVNMHSDMEIGLATNGSMMTKEIAERLAHTRTMVTLHFPAYDAEAYHYITKADFSAFLNCTKLLTEYHIPFSYNYVLYPETMQNFDKVLHSPILKARKIKLLPYIEEGFHNFSSEIAEHIVQELDHIALSRSELKTEEIITWQLENQIKVKMVHSPCYSANMESCRSYGEVRLLPNLELQKCIFDKQHYYIDINNKNNIREILKKMWDEFTYCYKLR